MREGAYRRRLAIALKMHARRGKVHRNTKAGTDFSKFPARVARRAFIRRTAERRATRRTFQGERDSSSEKKHRRMDRRRSLSLSLSFLCASSSSDIDAYEIFIGQSIRFLCRVINNSSIKTANRKMGISRVYRNSNLNGYGS